MARNSLFVGMVTHARSRFNVDGAAAELTHSLANLIRTPDLAVNVLVSDRDDYDPVTMPLRRSTLARSAVHQARLEHRWRRYLVEGGASGRGALADAAFGAGMALKRSGAFRRPAAIRLVNIDLSHLRLMGEALLAGAEWTLILEDDAGVHDLSSAAAQVSWLVSALDDTDIAFVSLSESLPLAELGVAELLRPAGDIPVPTDLGLALLRASRPVTNTVCATLYRADYLRVLRATILARGLVPIAPIDWRVNEAVLDLHSAGYLGSHSCVWTSPGVFLQRSMHQA